MQTCRNKKELKGRKRERGRKREQDRPTLADSRRPRTSNAS
jgi:hypothetical protein